MVHGGFRRSAKIQWYTRGRNFRPKTKVSSLGLRFRPPNLKAEYGRISNFRIFSKKTFTYEGKRPKLPYSSYENIFQFNVIKGRVDGNQFLPEYLHKNFQKIQVVKISWKSVKKPIKVKSILDEFDLTTKWSIHCID